MALSTAKLKQLRQTPPHRNRLRAARTLANLTQEEVAAAVGISQSAISDLERGRYNATTVDTAARFSGFFGCSIEDLFPATQTVQAHG